MGKKQMEVCRSKKPTVFHRGENKKPQKNNKKRRKQEKRNRYNLRGTLVQFGRGKNANQKHAEEVRR